MDLPKEAVTMETPHISPPTMTMGRLPKRLTSTLLTGPEGRSNTTLRHFQINSDCYNNV